MPPRIPSCERHRGRTPRLQLASCWTEAHGIIGSRSTVAKNDHRGLRTPGVGVREGTFRGFDTSSSTTMGTLFERFLLRFYARNGREFGWRSSSPQVRWNATPRQGANPSLLPIMNTDITLDRPSRSTIIEAKFYGGGAFTGRHNQPKFRSEPLYQLYAYLDNRSASMTEADGELTGLLLYADVAGGNITEPWTIGRHQMTIASVDLSAPWNEIHDRLMQLGHES